MHMGVWGGFMMAAMGLLWLALPALIGWVAWTAARPRHQDRSPLDILKERYAQGQITHDQYEQTKEDLV